MTEEGLDADEMIGASQGYIFAESPLDKAEISC
jgi:hypothetical protein